jgi:hypothetical protein
MKCFGCKAEIVFATTAKGKQIPIDDQPSLIGNIRILDGVAHFLDKEAAGAAREAGEQLYVAHFATCPRADSFRKKD